MLIIVVITALVFLSLALWGASLTIILCVGFPVVTAIIGFVAYYLLNAAEDLRVSNASALHELQAAVESVAAAVKRLDSTNENRLERSEECEHPDKAPLKSGKTK